MRASDSKGEWSARKDLFLEEMSRLALKEASLEEARVFVKGHLEFVDSALDNVGSTALHMAAAKGSLELVKALIEAGASPARSGHFGSTALSAACRSRRGALAMARELLRAGADVGANAASAWLVSPLLGAAQTFGDRPREESESLCQELIEAGAPVGPVWASMTNGGADGRHNESRERVAEILLDAGAKIDAKGPANDETALFREVVFALRKNGESLARLLLDRGANPNVVSGGQSVLALCARAKSEKAPELALWLLEAGADPWRPEEEGPSVGEMATGPKGHGISVARGAIVAWLERQEIARAAEPGAARKGRSL